jgi:hypothetical protein
MWIPLTPYFFIVQDLYMFYHPPLSLFHFYVGENLFGDKFTVLRAGRKNPLLFGVSLKRQGVTFQ